MGLPPRVRGKEYLGGGRYHVNRITPACAGKSETALIDWRDGQDHPRVCGVKNIAAMLSYMGWGSPPRVRGKEGLAQQIVSFLRITPAYAGKRRTIALLRGHCEDHPRVCGEKVRLSVAGLYSVGSPPRVRGKVDLNDYAIAGV